MRKFLPLAPRLRRAAACVAVLLALGASQSAVSRAADNVSTAEFEVRATCKRTPSLCPHGVEAAVADARANGFSAYARPQSVQPQALAPLAHAAGKKSAPAPLPDTRRDLLERYCASEGEMAYIFARKRDAGEPLAEVIRFINKHFDDTDLLPARELNKALALSVYERWHIPPDTIQQRAEVACWRDMQQRWHALTDNAPARKEP
jgi:hypothetical protein